MSWGLRLSTKAMEGSQLGTSIGFWALWLRGDQWPPVLIATLVHPYVGLYLKQTFCNLLLSGVLS